MKIILASLDILIGSKPHLSLESNPINQKATNFFLELDMRSKAMTAFLQNETILGGPFR